jgi:hypothetical protein
MLTPRLTYCPECSSIPSLIKDIDCRLTELGSNLYNNMVFLTNLPTSNMSMLDLINYKRILNSKFYNPNYASDYTVNMIASRVKILKYK